MQNPSSNPPYFDGLFRRLNSDDSTTVAAFGRHVHWGYWQDPSQANCSPEDYGEAAEEMCRIMFETGGIRDGMRIVDVGCGFGGTLASLNDRFSDLELVGVNIDARQLDRASEMVQANNGNSINFVKADASCIPLADDSFDVVLAVESVFHFDRRGFFAEADRLLDHGGNLTLSDFVPSERAAEYLDAFDVSADEEFRWSYGQFDLSCSMSRYQELAQTNKFVLDDIVDITDNTLPTYDFLYSSTLGWTDPRQVESFTRATRMLEKACRNGMMGYQILRFARTD